MAAIPTVIVIRNGEHVRINESDYNPARDRLAVPPGETEREGVAVEGEACDAVTPASPLPALPAPKKRGRPRKS